MPSTSLRRSGADRTVETGLPPHQRVVHGGSRDQALAHPIDADVDGRDLRRGLQVARRSGGRLPEPHLLGNQARQEDLDPCQELALGVQVHVLDLLAVDETEGSLALLDRDDLDLAVAPLKRVGGDRVDPLVDGNHHLLAVGVRHRLFEADLLGQLRLPQVVPAEARI